MLISNSIESWGIPGILHGIFGYAKDKRTDFADKILIALNIDFC